MRDKKMLGLGKNKAIKKARMSPLPLMKFDVERELALKAVQIVQLYDGEITFEQFDKAMFNVTYFTPLNWSAGWGLPPSLRKANTDKLCIFKACELGWVEQTKTGYKII